MKSLLLNIISILILFHSIAWSQDKYIVVDPGHVWNDAVTGYKTELEVLTNLNVSEKFENLVESFSDLDWDVRLTRTDNDPDTRLTLSDREKIANDLEIIHPGKVYFLSVHCNAQDNGNDAHGTETFYCTHGFNTDEELLIDYAMNIQNNMHERGVLPGRNNRCVEDRNSGYFSYHLGVLDNLTMPNCLNEIGFVTNYSEARKLENEGWRSTFALAYLEGFKETFADLKVASYYIEKVPCYATGDYRCKINVTFNNPSNTQNYYGAARIKLKYFPLLSFDIPNSDFCQLDNNMMVSIPVNESQTISFESDIPYTDEIGLAICIESLEYGAGDWKKVPVPNERRLLKLPVNSAEIKGTIYDDTYESMLGISVWSYPESLIKKVQNKDDYPEHFGIDAPYFYDPTTAISDGNGKYNLLVPANWTNAVISMRNTISYDEQLIDPIENTTLTHYHTNNPVTIGIGCGGGGEVCPDFPYHYPDNPIQGVGDLHFFEGVTVNNQRSLAYIYNNKSLTFDVFPKPVLTTEIIPYTAGCVRVAYWQLNGCGIYLRSREVDCNIFGGGCSTEYYFPYFLSVYECNSNLETTSSEYMGWFELSDNGDNAVSRPITDIPLQSNIQSLGVDLKINKFYRLKLAIDKGGWVEKIIYLYVLEDNASFSGSIDNSKYFTIGDMLIEDASINHGGVFEASESIIIKPNTIIKSDFIARINQHINTNKSQKNSSSFTTTISNDSIQEINPSNNQFVIPERKKLEIDPSKHFCACGSINESPTGYSIEKNSILVYPNPINNTLYIEMSDEIKSITSIDIFSISSQHILSQTEGISRVNEFNTSTWQDGIYIIRVTTSEGYVVKRLIKQ